jgi:hypothetical protein
VRFLEYTMVEASTGVIFLGGPSIILLGKL